ncbi:Glycoside hydrolase family 18 protein [Rhizoctonia solani]|uniref:AA9 family lytic polysaccharide monooxygenase n=1 Tax=Rhizoctonia solani TaxID=456999 RepID=A0A8H7ID94_9AGAM|nr:Glycoside hydrolase family 18 protein [Rhizoctonia solani]
MKFSTIAAVLASAGAAMAHAKVRAVFVNGVDQGNGENSYIRSPPNNSPVKDLSSDDIICNVNNAAVPKTLEVTAGDQITFEWSHDNRNDDIIDASHKGPALVYVAPTSSNGQGNVWVKLYQEVYPTTNGSVSHITVTVPDLEAGEYLFRPELVTLHEADTAFNVNSARGVQLYMECIQFKVTSSGSVKLPAGIDLKKSYTYSDKGLVYNLYNEDAKTYVAPGGAVSSIAVAGQLGIGPVPAAGSKPSSTASPAPTTTEAAPEPTSQPATTAAPVTSTRAPLPTSKMTTVTVRSSTVVPSATAPVETLQLLPALLLLPRGTAALQSPSTTAVVVSATLARLHAKLALPALSKTLTTPSVSKFAGFDFAFLSPF